MTVWVQAMILGDRRFYLSSGPFNLNPHENASFTFAIVWARGINNLDSILELRMAADRVRSAYEANAFEDEQGIERDFSPAVPNFAAAVDQNYPEPFTDRTTIRYRLPHIASVRIVVLDVLGREVETLVRETQGEGEHLANFDGSNLPSGVYFYRIEIGHASATRSMMLVK